MTTRIRELLALRNAELRSSEEPDKHQCNVARMISKNFAVYDQFRRDLNRARVQGGLEPESEAQRGLWQALVTGNFAQEMAPNRFAPLPDDQALKYLTGGWLEDLAYEAILEAGADSALARAVLAWEVDGYGGKNEVDVLARKAERLIFFSCKCASAWLVEDNMRARAVQKNTLMDYLHEADNLADHFGSEGDAVVLMITTDLVDEGNRNRARLPTLFGKAKALDVELIGLDHLGWRSLVTRLRAILGNRPTDSVA